MSKLQEAIDKFLEMVHTRQDKIKEKVDKIKADIQRLEDELEELNMEFVNLDLEGGQEAKLPALQKKIDKVRDKIADQEEKVKYYDMLTTDKHQYKKEAQKVKLIAAKALAEERKAHDNAIKRSEAIEEEISKLKREKNDLSNEYFNGSGSNVVRILAYKKEYLFEEYYEKTSDSNYEVNEFIKEEIRQLASDNNFL